MSEGMEGNWWKKKKKWIIKKNKINEKGEKNKRKNYSMFLCNFRFLSVGLDLKEIIFII